MSRHNFKKMKIWQDAMILSDSIFKTTKSFPKSEIYSLTSQINRSTISVPSNIAEGSSRSSNKEFNRYLEISLGSLYELNTQLILAKYQEYISNKSFQDLELKIVELQKMISGFQNALK
jgi:four helix bundle protein